MKTSALMLSGTVLAFALVAPVSLRADSDTIVSENMILDANADWREQGEVTVAEGVTIDIAG